MPAHTQTPALPETISPAPARRRPLRLLGVATAATTALAASLLVAPQAQAAPVAAHTSAEIKIIRAVFTELNAERKAHKLPALKLNKSLNLSSRRHDLTMAKYNELSHQLPHEAFFANRISAAGYKWTSVGENIAWTSVGNVAGVVALEVAMYNEKAPNDGHRVNILSKNYSDVGVDVYIDHAHHKAWLTTDFGHH